MKISNKKRNQQRTRLDRKLKPWIPLREQTIPRKGWLKSIREALGLSSYQLANRLGLDHTRILRLEEGEIKKTTTLGSLEKAARAMGSRLIYAIVPVSEESLDALLERKAYEAARKVVKDVSFSMELEEQGVTVHDREQSVQELAKKMKENLDAEIWGQK